MSILYTAIRRFFNFLVEENIIDKNDNPITRIPKPHVEKKVIRPFTPDEIKKLLLLCEERLFTGLRDKALILTFYDTGLRLKEITNIQLENIDLKREIIKVMGKGARERYVRISTATQKAIIKYLLQRRDNFPCLWVSEERKPLTVWGIYQIVHRLGQRAGLSGVRCSPHTFRHSFGTAALRNHADIRQVQVMLGHSTLNTTMRYVATIASEDAINAHRGDHDKPGFSPVENMLR